MADDDEILIPRPAHWVTEFYGGVEPELVVEVAEFIHKNNITSEQFHAAIAARQQHQQQEPPAPVQATPPTPTNESEGTVMGSKRRTPRTTAPLDPSIWKPIAGLPPGTYSPATGVRGKRQQFVELLQASPDFWFPYKENDTSSYNYSSELPGTEWAWKQSGFNDEGEPLFITYGKWTGIDNKGNPVGLDGKLITGENLT